MTLRWQILAIISLILFSLIMLLYVSAQSIILSSFAQLEQTSIERDVQRVVSALDESLKELDIFTLDWASWDDTYTFIVDGNQAYIDSNLTDQFFVDSQLNLVVFVDRSGRVVFEKAFDATTQQIIPVPQGLQAQLTPEHLLNHPHLTSRITGILRLSQGFLVVASRPITTSLKTGPIRGALIMGRYFDTSFVENLAQTTHLAVTWWPFDQQQFPPDVQSAIGSLSEQNPVVVNALNDYQIGGYTLLNDLDQQPALLLRIEEARVIYQHGQASLSYLLVSLIIIGLSFAIVVLILLERLIIARLLALGQAVNQARSHITDLSVSIPIHGRDELAQLATNIQGLLTTIKQYQVQLQQTNAELEDRIQVRTHELAEAVADLQQEVAQREQAQREVIQARDQAVEALQIKMQILANISHDVRSPLTVITLAVGLLRRSVQSDVKAMRQLDNILMSANQMLGFFNNLLEEARASSGRVYLNDTCLFPADLLENVVSPLHVLAEKKGLHLMTVIEPDLPTRLYADYGRLEQILSNLVNNAIKFTTQGYIQVRLFMPDPQHWAIQVTDTGPGIALQDQAHIFETFWQVDGSMSRSVNRGVGLGLSIVKRLTELMGGTVAVQSELGAGATFIVCLPLKLEVMARDE